MIFSSCCCRFISNPKTAPDSCSTSMLCHRRTVLGRRRENISGHRRRRVVISWCRREAVLSSRTSTCRWRNFPAKTGGEESEFVIISDDSQIFIFFKNFRIRFDCRKRQIDCFLVHLFFWRGEGLSLEVSHGGSWRGRWHSCKFGVEVGVCKYKKKDIWDEMQGNCS